MEVNKIYIGIDPGVDTGCAIIVDGKYEVILTGKAYHVEKLVEEYAKIGTEQLELWVEDPNLRTYLKDKKPHHLQGAGSVKRDYSRWEEFAECNGIKMIPISPQMVGSLFNNVKVFKDATNWTDRTSIHARDAARIIYRFFKK